MGSYGGRVQCILLSTLNGYVIYESFYDQFNDIQKAEIRTSFDDALGSHDIEHGLDVVGRFKNGKVVGMVSEDVILFTLGTGNCDEMTLLELMEAMAKVLKEVTKSQSLSDAVIFEHYPDVVHAIDEMCKDGIIELLDVQTILKSMQLKMPTYNNSQLNEKLRGLVKKFKSKETILGASRGRTT